MHELRESAAGKERLSMNAETIQAVGLILTGAGARTETAAAVRSALELDGMCPVPTAAKLAGVDRVTIWRLCKRHGIRRIERGRLTTLVELGPLLAAAVRPATHAGIEAMAMARRKGAA